MSNASHSSGPCSGLRVVEFATVVSGPFCGQALADLGAEVIKVETPEGDNLRHLLPRHQGMAAMFMQYNRGKKGVVINLKSPEGVAVARRLAESADVVIENFRPGVMERLGLGYERLRETNKRLVYVSITGFGDSGPYVDRPAYDQVVQGMSGFMWIQGRGEKPVAVRNTIVDKVCAQAATQAVLAALLFRERSGEGQRVSVPMLDAYAAFILPGSMNNDIFLAPGAQRTPARDIYQVVQASDGYLIGHIGTMAQFEGCCRVFGREDLLNDPRFSTAGLMVANVSELWPEMEVGARQRSVRELLEAAAKYSVPLGPVYTVEQLIADPQAVHNNIFVAHDDPELGPVRQVAFPARFECSPALANARAPKLGEHTDATLRDLGLSEEEIDSMRAAGVVR